MASVKIKKLLTHDFEIKGKVQNFDEIMQKILDKVTFLDVECNKQVNFQSKTNTSLVINVKQSVNGIDSYPKVFALKGVIFKVHYGQYNTNIYFIDYDWFSGDINDIIVQCITKEGV